MKKTLAEPFNTVELNSKIDSTSLIFRWAVGGLAAAVFAAFFYLLTRVDAIDAKYHSIINDWQIQINSNISSVENKYQTDHDKIIRLDTMLQNMSDKTSK